MGDEYDESTLKSLESAASEPIKNSNGMLFLKCDLSNDNYILNVGDCVWTSAKTLLLSRDNYAYPRKGTKENWNEDVGGLNRRDLMRRDVRTLCVF